MCLWWHYAADVFGRESLNIGRCHPELAMASKDCTFIACVVSVVCVCVCVCVCACV